MSAAGANWTGQATIGLASLIGLAAYLYPFWLPAVETGGDAVAHATDAPLLLAALGLAIAVALWAEATQSPHRSAAKLVALLGVLVAINSTLRLLPTIGGASPLWLLILLVGYVFGSTYGFLTGALTLFVSALMTGGVGPWLPYQMLGAGWLGLSAGWLPDLRRQPRWEQAMLAGFGGLWGLLYGAILNLWFWPYLDPAGLADPTGAGWQPGSSPAVILQHYLAFYLLTSLWYDLLRSAGTVVLVVALSRPLLGILRRYRRRLGWTTMGVTAPRTAKMV